MDKNKTVEILKKYDFKFTKSLGQNFLIDDRVLDDIIESSNISKDDIVIEIGPGFGALTRKLLGKAKKVIAIELDSSLIPILEEELEEFDNLEIINEDALKYDFNNLNTEGSKFKIVANLPYYITTPILSKLIDYRNIISSITIMIQEEVARRIVSKPNSKDYGALSIYIQLYCNTSTVTKVKSTAFMPQPKVDSQVIKLEFLDKPKVDLINEEYFFKIVRSSFNQRRKTLSNSLKSLGLSKEDLMKSFEVSDIDPIRRGETLSIEEFALLSNNMVKIK
ncbi:MAG: 16S rRNA (adenine(1518)-N(6)/adenine(1519)-N(6))-dimethyltransferase RsmA [Clostridiaceae bacterium]